MKPLARAMKAVVRAAFRLCINSGFANLAEVRNASTTFLQAKADRAATDTGRLAVNSTLRGGWVLRRGDPDGPGATARDFGLTLARWGVGTGPYVFCRSWGRATCATRSAWCRTRYTNPVSYVTPVRDRYILYGCI